jgi:excisionase family DNA binding protein
MNNDGNEALPPYLSPRQVAKLLGVNVKTVYAAIERRELKSVRVGRTLRVPREEIEGRRK